MTIRLFSLYASLLIFGAITMSSSCLEEGEWLEYDEAATGKYIASGYVTDTTFMHLAPVASVQKYLKDNGKFIAQKMRILSSGSISCACSKRINGSCLCKLPNNQRHECGSKDDDGKDICRREKVINIFVAPEDVDKAKSLGFK